MSRSLITYEKPAFEWNWRVGVLEYFVILNAIDVLNGLTPSVAIRKEKAKLELLLKECAQMNRKQDLLTYNFYQKQKANENLHNQHPVYCQPCNSGSFQNAHR